MSALFCENLEEKSRFPNSAGRTRSGDSPRLRHAANSRGNGVVNEHNRKVLKRVCAQYHTGIRKPFGVNGKIYKLVTWGNKHVGLELQSYTSTPSELSDLKEVTPEAILESIQLQMVAEIMES
jgi:hypothetical protein